MMVTQTSLPIGTQLICIETGLPSMLILGQIYIVIKSFPHESPRGPIIQIDNGVITYASKFTQKSAKETT